MQHNKGQQIMNTQRSKSAPAGKEENQTAGMATETPKQRHGLNTTTAYAKVTDVMEVAYTKTSHAASQPLYTASQVVPVVDQLATHSPARGKDEHTIKGKLPVRNAAAGTAVAEAVQAEAAQAEAKAEASTAVSATAEEDAAGEEEQANPFALPHSSLTTWHQARTALSTPAHFYTTVQKHYPLHKAGQPKPHPEERFAVRVLDTTLEIEQGLADLRAVLNECQKTEDGRALEGLRRRVEAAVEGLGEDESESESESEA